jgi:hypothetical protein
MVLTGRTNDKGELTLALHAPAQPWEERDRVAIGKQYLVRIPE